jgi:hypothetical protein
MIRDADPDSQVAVGATIGKGGRGQWVKEVSLDVNKHVRHIHTEFMLVDPLGHDPLDENMLLIRGIPGWPTFISRPSRACSPTTSSEPASVPGHDPTRSDRSPRPPRSPLGGVTSTRRPPESSAGASPGPPGKGASHLCGAAGH